MIIILKRQNPNKSNRKGELVNSKVKIYFRVCFAVFVLSFILFVASLFSQTFAEILSRTVCNFTRSVMARLTSPFPFSFAEVLVVVGIPSLLIYTAVIVILAFFRRGDCVKTNTVFLCGTLMLFASLYFLNIGISYHRYPLERNLGIQKETIDKEQLLEGALFVNAELTKCSEDVTYSESGHSVMPYSFDELSDKLDEAYEKLCNDFDFIKNVKANSKRVALSEYMTYTHISGVYMPLTGEANVNTNYPDYVVAFSSAHEKAHQRGIAGEDEANFVAFLACMYSDDEYIRYSSYMSMLDYYLSALLKTDENMYYEVINSTAVNVCNEMKAYYEFFRKYSFSSASKVAEKVNDTHLKLQGQKEGTVSYGLVVELYQAYRNQKKKTPD